MRTTALALVLALGTAAAIAAPLDLNSDDFPIGMYSVDSEGAMEQVKAMGVDYVHTYGMGGASDAESIEKCLAYMDLAEKHGLKVMAYLNGRKWASEHGLLEMHKIAMALKDHPALGFWLMYDEPSGKHTTGDLMPFYWLLKYEAPLVPVCIVEAWTKDWWDYTEACDILQLDHYPVADQPFPNAPLHNVTTFIGRGVGLESKPIMPVLQCMNWKVFGAAGASRAQDPANLRYPNATELLYWSYSSLAQGVRGLFWWSYYRSVQGGYGWIDSEFKNAMLEVRAFTDLVKPAHKPQRFQYAADEAVYMALWKRPAGDYLVLANGQPIARRISRGGEGLLPDKAKLEPWGHTRTAEATLEGGQVTVTAEPWETFVWKLSAPNE
ncbi:MAG: hypothetical protein QM473_03280 [Acidobacteriota bacterium]|nr:hypothetical protein [Acidobacteriota bacterium]